MLQGKTPVITGCLQGIGRETMRCFAQNGCNIFACSYKKEDEFEQEVRKLKDEFKVKIIPVYFEMRDSSAVKEAAVEIQKEKRSIDILVNIAGIARDAIFQMVTMDQIRKHFK